MVEWLWFLAWVSGEGGYGDVFLLLVVGDEVRAVSMKISRPR